MDRQSFASRELCVPQDIINVIVDEVAIDYADASTVKQHPLHSCALVCHAFYSRTIHHIFSKIEIGQTQLSMSPEYVTSRTARLQTILACNPNIGLTVRTLVLQAGQPKARGVGLLIPSTLFTGFWTTKNSLLVDVIGYFVSLQNIIFQGGTAVSTWGSLHRNTASAVRNTMCSSSLRRLEIRQMSGIPSRTLLDCPKRLKEIILHDVDVRLGSLSVIPVIGPFPQIGAEYQNESDYLSSGLEYLELTTSFTIKQMSLLWIKRNAFSGLRQIAVDFGNWYDNEDGLWPVIQQAARNLQVIKISWDRAISGNEERARALQLELLPSLRILHLEFVPTPQGITTSVHRILDIRESDSNLMTIYLCTNWRHNVAFSLPWWNQLDKMLSNKGFRRLQKIVLVQKDQSKQDSRLAFCRGQQLDAVLTDDSFNFNLPRVLEKVEISVETRRFKP